MHVIGQDYPCVYLEGTVDTGGANSVAQGFDLADERIGSARSQSYRKEYGRAGNTGSEVAGHGGRIGQIWLRNPYGVEVG